MKSIFNPYVAPFCFLLGCCPRDTSNDNSGKQTLNTHNKVEEYRALAENSKLYADGDLNARFWHLKGNVEQASGYYEEAIKSYNLAIRACDVDDDVWFWRSTAGAASCYISLKDYKAAAKMMDALSPIIMDEKSPNRNDVIRAHNKLKNELYSVQCVQ